MFVGVLKAIKGVKIEVEQKKSFLADIHRVNMGLRGLGCGQYKRTTFEGFLCIFLKILAKDMGKPLVPAVPRHLGHLGHPKVAGITMTPVHLGLPRESVRKIQATCCTCAKNLATNALQVIFVSK